VAVPTGVAEPTGVAVNVGKGVHGAVRLGCTVGSGLGAMKPAGNRFPPGLAAAPPRGGNDNAETRAHTARRANAGNARREMHFRLSSIVPM